MNTPEAVEATHADAVEVARAEYLKTLWKCTPKQRKFLRELPKYEYQEWAACEKLGFSKHTLWRWKREERFAKALELILKRTVAEIGQSHASIIARTNAVIERCMQARPVVDGRGDRVLVEIAGGQMLPAYSFDSLGALRGLEALAKWSKLEVARHEFTGKDGEPLPGAAPVIQFVERASDDDKD